MDLSEALIVVTARLPLLMMLPLKFRPPTQSLPAGSEAIILGSMLGINEWLCIKEVVGFTDGSLGETHMWDPKTAVLQRERQEMI